MTQTYTWNDHLAGWCFAGIRKLISSEDFEARPTRGPEVSDTELVVNNEADIARFQTNCFNRNNTNDTVHIIENPIFVDA